MKQAEDKTGEESLKEEYFAKIKSLREHVSTILADDYAGHGAFIKLNWKAPLDARWVNLNLQCITSDDVFYLLKSSKAISDQLLHA